MARMLIDQDTLKQAIQFLVDGGEFDAANLLRTCTVIGAGIVESWMNSSGQLDEVLVELGCPRQSYEILTDPSHLLTKRIEQAFNAILPSDIHLTGIRVRAVVSTKTISEPTDSSILNSAKKDLIRKVESQKALMTAVATGGPRINEKNSEYEKRRLEIKQALRAMNIDDPNHYSDLWTWYGKWSDGSLPTYQSRRTYLTQLYQPLLDLLNLNSTAKRIDISEPTGWARVDRNVDKMVRALESANNEEDFQVIGLLCREAMISLAQAVYNPDQHDSLDGITPSDTDAKRMLVSYIVKELSGPSHEAHRKFVKALYDLAVTLQHRRTAGFRDSALCAEATRSLINAIAIISGQRDPVKAKSQPSLGGNEDSWM